jgi:hypothetical protein
MRIIFTFFLLLVMQNGFSQSQFKSTKKGSFTLYWGWNFSWYTDSDISFEGIDYNFTLNDVNATDRPTEFSIDAYLNPTKITIPQYNVRVGYFFKDNWMISVGDDHMKYVVQQNQKVNISGEISNSNTQYNSTYADDEIVLSEDFLKLEHTDGLNYINTEVRHYHNFYKYKKHTLCLISGIGIGALIPKTDATLLSKPRHDDFHLAGYGTAALVGLNLSFFDQFYIQSELKGGYINMPDIKTTFSDDDSANQSFFFSQLNIVFGGVIYFGK